MPLESQDLVQEYVLAVRLLTGLAVELLLYDLALM
jgi:hypothetical protein